ncbi:uncharacterized protein Z518_00593 [Rhinocladiella mackenziei CBS 650.93]|uniref:Uncharacterized protein n=1 Tax=Rhinocladiella mackenziei CBS 650.93 TaxID=1442369 RepID=A0A0D2HFU8_9EURO|nr:uncharacterized protein Z518_00593 [Rhinocladiella mackenziei CBS 650.93]KIX09513.1 hypothetical protein Z518_00593 [Rhinocladiella mackenziei CBS 650.93]
MSFLHRRSRSASASRPQTPASASAHMAATQAFLASRASQANLSASAAATALRTMSPTPTPVDQVQTKRMIQRQASLGALSGSARGRSRGGLQRQSSNGSMTERTFRTPSPSPSRQPSRSGLVEAPPLPDIPQEFAHPSPLPVKKKKRASSQEAPPPRVSSPPLTRPVNRGQSLDRYDHSQQTGPPQRNNNLPKANELERADSRNSINFSRPLSPRPQSPVTPSPVGQSPMLTRGEQPASNAVARAISPVQAENIQYGLTQTASQPVKKKKKKIVSGSAEGNHLHTGTLASKPVVTPLEPGPERDVQMQGQELPPVKRKKKKKKVAVSGPNAHFPPSDTSSRTDSDSDSTLERTRERHTQRASGVLAKRPSIVREDWEGEQKEEASPPQVISTTEQTLSPAQDLTTPLAGKRPISVANVSRKIEEPIVQPRTVNHNASSEDQAISSPERPETSPASSNGLKVVEPQPTRGSSLSPSRSTRFSDRLSSDLAAGRKHEPLPRSVSPAKSALKHHIPTPALSPGDPNQPQACGSSVTPSESSDMSSASTEGPPKRKKSVRVSFDSQPEIVGTAATPQSPESPEKEEKKGWLGLGKKPTLDTVPSNDDIEALMKPRPQLPSFGSVRGQKFRDMNDSDAAHTPRSLPENRLSAPILEGKTLSPSITSSETSSSSYIAGPTIGVSSDHAVGAILALEAQRASQAGRDRGNEPVPPEVTSVQGTVSFSDSESESSETEETSNAIPPDDKGDVMIDMAPKSDQAPNHDQRASLSVEIPSQPEVPVVSVSPPTPALEQTKPDDQWQVDVPGGFPELSEPGAPPQEPKKPSLIATDVSETSSGLEIESTENESDTESIYSDAAEDPSELDRTVFGSINAIVDSPIVATPPESPLAQVSQPRPPQAQHTDSWEAAQARWSGIAEQRRQAPAQAQALTTQPGRAPPPKQLRSSQPRRKRKSPAAIAAAASVPAAALAAQGLLDSPPRRKNLSSAYPMIEQTRPEVAAAAAAPFRLSMRAGAPSKAEPSFRKSMRHENRDSRVHPVAMQQQRPPQQPRAALQKKPAPPPVAAPTPAPAPRIPAARPVPSNDSDSESSFKRARRTKSTTGGKYTMRRSMRGVPEPSMRDNGRYVARSLSPVGRRPFSPPTGPHTMRTSMRGSVDNTVPTLRGSAEAKRSSSLFGRRQKSSPSAPSADALAAATHRYQSRIADSDDEDDQPTRSQWRSRYADDSDDESEMAHFTPVRGIPRRGNDGDSTDLEDSSDDEKQLPAQAPAKLQIPPNSVSAPSGEPRSPSSGKSRGLLGIFRSKKEQPSSPVAAPLRPPAKADTRKPSQLGFSSAAERDRIIEQTRAGLEAAKDQQHVGSPPTHGKLHRRQQPQRIMSDTWPLPPKPRDNTINRPNTSDGAPLINGMTTLNQGRMRTEEPFPAVGRSGKKKRFPMLRKAFGLKD